jgi:hypothetical protein
MKPENPAEMRDAAIAFASSATDRRNEKRLDKKVKLSLEAGLPGSAVVLHCQGRIIFGSEARVLSTIVAEVLPSRAGWWWIWRTSNPWTVEVWAN